MPADFRSLSQGTNGTSSSVFLLVYWSHSVVPKKKWGFLLLGISIAHIPCPLTEQHKPGKTQWSYFFLQKSVNNWNSLANMIFCTNTSKMFHTQASYFCLHINMIRKYLWLDIHQKVNIYSPSCYFQNHFAMFQWNLLQPTIILHLFKATPIISSRVQWPQF